MVYFSIIFLHVFLAALFFSKTSVFNALFYLTDVFSCEILFPTKQNINLIFHNKQTKKKLK